MYCGQRRFCASKGFIIGGLILVSLFVGGALLKKYQAAKRTISYDEAISRIQSNRIREININNDKINLIGTDNKKYSTDISENQKLEVLQTGNSMNLVITLDNNQAASPMLYLFQLLFWAFLISPPVIVVLLLVIIKKMNEKSSIK